MYYTVYKTTNKINGKIYIGAHKTNDLDDGYLGSGKHLGYAIEKYGIENFEKEILAVFNKASEMFEMESELVNEDFINSDDTYNLKIGGHGGFDFINENDKNLYGKNGTKGCGLENLTKGRETRRRLLNEDIVWTENFKNNVSLGMKKYYVNGGKNGFKGRRHSEETKQKISKLSSERESGSGNSQFGTMWITNGTENKKIKKECAVPEGWQKGRKIKHL